MSDASTTESHDSESSSYQPPVDSDAHVEARWQVSVIPDESVSIHYTVSPKSSDDAVTSVTASFVLLKNHTVFHNFAGSTTQDLIAPRNGQGVTGQVGVDVDVFKKFAAGQLAAILAGTVRSGEEVYNFYFQRDFDPDQP